MKVYRCIGVTGKFINIEKIKKILERDGVGMVQKGMRWYLVAMLTLLLVTFMSCTEKVRETEQMQSEGKSEYVPVDDARTLSAYEGRKVRVKGKISEAPWQHLIASPDSFPIATYFDIGDYQIMVYSSEPIACADSTRSISIKGTVIKVQSKDKHPKADEVLTEFHITVDSWECIDAIEEYRAKEKTTMTEKEYEFEELISKSAKKEKSEDEYIVIDGQDEIQKYDGKKIAFEGTIAMIPWQHLINLPDTHQNINYLNIGNENEQVVVYSKSKINCKAKVSIKGTVVKTKGTSKRPGSDEVFIEYQVIADSWECIKYGD